MSVAFGTLSCAGSTNPPGGDLAGSGDGGTSTGGSLSGGAGGGGSGTGGAASGSGGSANGGTGAGATAGSGSAGLSGGAGASGSAGAGGAGGSGGTSGSAGSGGSTVNCSGTLPTGGTAHTSKNASGNAAGLSWSIWSNGNTAGTLTTYGSPAFSASWNNAGDFLARVGLEWGNSGKTFDKFGTITAQFAETKTGSAGGYSYVGIYGWSTNPCVEYYIVDDSFNKMPVNPGTTTNKGTASIDGGTYNLYTRSTSGTGGSRCSGVSNWAQFYSIRQTARQCGQISITEHFKAWAAAGMTLGSMLEAKILIEVGGGTGSIDFTTANVTAQ